MHNLTKTFLTSLALTLGACDADTVEGFGEGSNEFRPGVGTFSMNTSFIGETADFGEMNLRGEVHKFSQLTKVCFDAARSPCINPQKDSLWLDDIGQINAQGYAGQFSGTQFENSRWYLNLDYDRNGTLDSTIILKITKVVAKFEPNTKTDYWEYHWAYETLTATGLVVKYIKPNEQPTPMCAPDEDKEGSTFESVASIQLSASVDTTPATDGVVKKAEHVMLSACYGGALAKAYVGWGYPRPQHIGYEQFTNVIRVLRADYCNTGESFTAPGQALTVSDGLGYNWQFDASLPLEGRATFSGGWECISRPRMVDVSDVTSACAIPICDEKDVDPSTVDWDDILTQVY